MEVSVTDDLAAHVLARGGVLWVRADPHRCCTGTLVTLTARTGTPREPNDYVALEGDLPIEVRFSGGARRPDRLVLELRGRRRPRPAAYWDGSSLAL